MRSVARALPGRGVEARVDGTSVAVGGPALLRELGIPARLVLVRTGTRLNQLRLKAEFRAAMEPILAW